MKIILSHRLAIVIAVFFLAVFAAGASRLGLIASASGGVSGTGEAGSDGASDTSLWQFVKAESLAAPLPGTTVPKSYRTLRLDRAKMQELLTSSPAESAAPIPGQETIVPLPMPNGKFARFSVTESSIMEEGLQIQFPEIRTYAGKGLDDPTSVVRFDLTPAGFHAMVMGADGTFFIDPYAGDETYITYFKRDAGTPEEPFACLFDDRSTKALAEQAENIAGDSEPLASYGTTLRTYRLAVAATGEYTAFHGGTATLGQAAIVTAVNRVNLIYQSEMSLRLILIANNSLLVYTNAATDPYTNSDGGAMLDQNQTNLDNIIGSANYDIGHVFSTGGGGIAGLGVVGTNGQKGRGVTGSPSPTGDAFWVDYVAHEMGHQFGGNHTFNSNIGSCTGNRNAPTAYEQGSGSTIMAYAGICSTDNLQPNSDPYFHWKSLDEISNYTNSGNGVGNTQTPSGNSLPVVNAGGNFTIPANTAFALTGSASDANGDALTYLWEEADLGGITTVAAADNGTSPLFRSWNPTASPTRIFPRLSNLLANTLPVGEVMPTTNRQLNFRLTVFDNRTNGGFSSANMTATVVNTGAPFAVTSPNTAVSLTGGTVQAVTWNVAGTTANGINASDVDIYLSTDGGNTFPTKLAGPVPNNGSANVIIPNTPSTTARIKVQPVGNIFFDVSNVNFTIAAGSTMQVASFSPAAGSVVSTPAFNLDVAFTQNVNMATVATSDLTVTAGTVSAVSQVNPTTVRFTISGLVDEGTINVTIPAGSIASTGGALTGAATANYTIDVATVALPFALAQQQPAGSLVYAGSAAFSVNSGADIDSFTIPLDAGQTLTAVVTPSAALQPSVAVVAPGGATSSALATSAGQNAIVNTFAAPTTGVYTINVSGLGGTLGTYTLGVTLNSAVETEVVGALPNDVTGAAQNIEASAVTPVAGTTRLAVSGRTEGGNSPTAETEPNDSIATAVNAAGDFGAVSGNLYGMTISGSSSNVTEDDYYNIGAMQPGDVITITVSGADTGLGTHLDPFVYLYRAGSATEVVSNDDRTNVVNLFDSLVFRFTVTTADTYYVRVTSAGGNGGSYVAGIRLENTAAAPTTGSGLFTETAPNETIATAENASASWKSYGHKSSVTGSVATATDVDFFQYSLAAGDLITATATSGSTANLALSIWDAGGNKLYDEKGVSTALGNNSSAFSFRAASSGLYYVRVATISGTTGAYTLDVDLATSGTPPIGLSGNDVYSFTATASQRIGAALKHGAGNANLAILNSAGTVVATGAAGASNFEENIAGFTAATAGTYYVRISGDPNVDYQIVVTKGGAFDSEPNDSFATAQDISGSSGVSGYTADTDFYKFAVTTGQAITLVSSTPGDGPNLPSNILNPKLDLFDPSGTLVASGTTTADGRNERISFVAPTAGDYRVRITTQDALVPTFGEYFINLNLSVPTAAGVAVAGRVLGANGRPVVRALVTLTDIGGSSRSVRTNGSGSFVFSNVASGAVYTLGVRGVKDGSYAPRVIEVTEDVSGLDLTPVP